LLDSCPGFEFLRLNILAGPSKKMHVSDVEVSYELLQENEHSDISESKNDSEIDVNTSLCGEQSVRSDEETKMSMTRVACCTA
jgi:hypothetical protein